MSWFRIAASALALFAAGAEAQTRERAAFADAARFTSPRLTPFAGDAEFDAYVEALRKARRQRWSERAGPIRFASLQPAAPVQSDADDPPCPEDWPRCREPITVTGSRVSVRNASITNNQMAGVDEGDIVKQIGRYLLVLSDGRIFAIDTRPAGRPGLALSDRANVYRRPDADTWYDEMLVFGDRILVAGYSYDEGRTELSVFRLSPEGRLSREGLFTRGSHDYYSTTNYATRIVGDSLIIYSLFQIDELDEEDAPFSLSSMQGWTAGEPEPRSEEERERLPPHAGPQLLEAREIYRPVRLETVPSVHAFSVCPLGPLVAGRALRCRTTGFVGPQVAEWYVTADEAMLWALNWDDAREECGSQRPRHDEVVPAVIYRVPHFGGAPSVGGGRGWPFDQFSLQVNDSRLRALVDRRPHSCRRDGYAPAEPWYFEAPLSAFSETYSELPQGHYAEVPNPGFRDVANRFTESHLVYGGLSSYRRGFPEIDWADYEDDDADYVAYRRLTLSRPPAFVVPAGRPEAVRTLDIGHSVIRAERYGEKDVVLTGYRDRRGLSVSLIDLDGPPRIGSAIDMPGRFESEGRSHAFNSIQGDGGRGTIGLPTSPRDEGRPWWRSRASDISFLSVHGDRLGLLGEIVSTLEYRQPRYGDEGDQDGLRGYRCEVSCIDWYGNSRPIFTDGRIFALMGGELVEARRGPERMVELRRLDFLRARPVRR